MMRFSIASRAATFSTALAATLLMSSPLYAENLSQEDFMEACEDGGFGSDQNTAACACSYTFLTTKGTDLLRDATYILVDEGQEHQANYLQSETGGDQAKLLELAGESETMMDECDFVEE